MQVRETQRLRQEVKAMTRQEVIMKALEGKLTWIQAAEVIGVSARHMRRIKERYEKWGYDGLQDQRSGKPRRKRIPVATIREICRLKAEVYPDFSVQHFYEHAVEKHGLRISYNWTRLTLQKAGLVERAPTRGKHRRQRERRPMCGMLLHLDASTHAWVPGLPKWDLNILMDDADGRILYGAFVPEEGTHSTLLALEAILSQKGRFAALYHDCGSHFGRTSQAGQGPDEVQRGQVSRVLHALGIRQIFARSPQARGRSERAFGTIQQRLPQELRLHGITSYEAANSYLWKTFISDFNQRFTVKPAQPETAFVPLIGIDLRLLLSIQHHRVVQNDNTVQFHSMTLQIPQTKHRFHYVRCPVIVHEFLDHTLGISYQGHLLGTYSQDGVPLATKITKKRRAKA